MKKILSMIIFCRIFPKNPLGRPILGTNESIVKMKKSQIEKYYRDTYTGENIIVGATGDLDHQVFLKETEKHLGRRKHASIGTVRVAPKWKKSRRVIESSSDQIHMLMGFPTASYKDKHRFHGYILNTILGGGMTSRLYQSVRERKRIGLFNTFKPEYFCRLWTSDDLCLCRS